MDGNFLVYILSQRDRKAKGYFAVTNIISLREIGFFILQFALHLQNNYAKDEICFQLTY